MFGEIREVLSDARPARSPALMSVTVGSQVEVFWQQRNCWRRGVVVRAAEPGASMVVDFGYGVRRDVHTVADVWRLQADGVQQAAAVRTGTRVSVYWPGEGTCFSGRIASHDSTRQLWLVLYDDGDSRVGCCRAHVPCACSACICPHPIASCFSTPSPTHPTACVGFFSHAHAGPLPSLALADAPNRWVSLAHAVA